VVELYAEKDTPTAADPSATELKWTESRSDLGTRFTAAQDRVRYEPVRNEDNALCYELWIDGNQLSVRQNAEDVLDENGDLHQEMKDYAEEQFAPVAAEQPKKNGRRRGARS
jgi:hypothetical protein